ncbi:hypothetical protein [Streptomyces sp. bgisy034]|uniref:hypothetical protein n=1 Tax=Streptomyces sp. bgisy034 TaxID=3413774 RepID=UPI003EBE865D
MIRGLVLLFRYTSLRGALPWLLPALLPFVPGLLPSVSLWQPTLYLNELSVDVEDVQIPARDQFDLALIVLGAMSLWLVAPALLGMAQHVHFMIRERWIGYAAFALLSAWCLLIGAWNFAWCRLSGRGSMPPEPLPPARTRPLTTGSSRSGCVSFPSALPHGSPSMEASSILHSRT